MHAHRWGTPGMTKRCPGSHKTKQQARADKLAPVQVVEEIENPIIRAGLRRQVQEMRLFAHSFGQEAA